MSSWDEEEDFFEDMFLLDQARKDDQKNKSRSHAGKEVRKNSGRAGQNGNADQGNRGGCLIWFVLMVGLPILLGDILIHLA